MNDISQLVRTRIAPSPTGEDIHIGNLYTALINYITAKKNGGVFIVRIEDTDRTRLVEGAMEKILSTLERFGIVCDEGPGKNGEYGPYIQSERLPLYKKYAEELVVSEKAYYCFCSKEELEVLKEKNLSRRHWDVCEDKNNKERVSTDLYVVRLKVPANTEVKFHDMIRGEIVINTDQIDDQVLLKSDGFPTYHLAVVVDDYLMKISHVIRAEEWISSTPKHILLYNAFGWDLPFFAHVPILRNPDKSKLSKRKNPVWASWYLEEGFLPEAVLNYLALMGWGHPQGKEIFTLEELMDIFDLKDVQTVGPVFDIAKLRWMNQQYIQHLSKEELSKRLLTFYGENRDIISLLEGEKSTLLLDIISTRLSTLKELLPQVEYLFAKPSQDFMTKELGDLSLKIRQKFENISEADWSKEALLNVMKELMNQEKNIKMSDIYLLFTGSSKGLPLPDMLEILGRETTLSRLSQ